MYAYKIIYYMFIFFRLEETLCNLQAMILKNASFSLMHVEK